MKYIQAIKDKVVVEVLSLDKVTAGGIIIPEGAGENEPHRFGKVISVGCEVKDVEVGPTVDYCVSIKAAQAAIANIETRIDSVKND